MFREGADMFHLYGLFNFLFSIGASALFIYVLYRFSKKRKKQRDKR